MIPLLLRALTRVVGALRLGTIDARVAVEEFSVFPHLPLPSSPRPGDVIVYLGANIGTSTALLAHRYPGTTVVAVEMVPGNAELCWRNLARFAERCRVVEAAAWIDGGTVAYGLELGDEWEARIADDGPRSARAVSLNTLLAEFPEVAFLKINIEGAEVGAFPERTRAGSAGPSRFMSQLIPPNASTISDPCWRISGFTLVSRARLGNALVERLGPSFAARVTHGDEHRRTTRGLM